ncbi:hypothetical protein D3C87_1252550 [compost metagenome]
MLPGALRIDEAQYATGAEFAGFGINAAVDVLDADPFRRFDAVHQLNRNRRIVEEDHRTDQQLAQQFEDFGHARSAGGREPPTTLEQITVDRRQFSAGKFADRTHHTARLFQQTQFAALVVAKLLRQLFRGTGHGQLFCLQLHAAEAGFVECRQVACTMAQRSLNISGGRQNQLGIAEIEQAFFAVALEHILGQRHIAAPGRDRGLDFALLLPGQVSHRDAGKIRQTFDHQRVSRDASAKLLPGFCVGRGVNGRPATFAPALKSVEHQPLGARSVTCGRRQKVSRTARSEKRSRKRSSIISAH